MVQRNGCHNRAGWLFWPILLELDLVVVRTVGRPCIDARTVISLVSERWDESAKRAAADVQHSARPRWQVFVDERPSRVQPPPVSGGRVCRG